MNRSLFYTLSHNYRQYQEIEYRILEPIGNIPPAELERAYYRREEVSAMVA